MKLRPVSYDAAGPISYWSGIYDGHLARNRMNQAQQIRPHHALIFALRTGVLEAQRGCIHQTDETIVSIGRDL